MSFLSLRSWHNATASAMIATSRAAAAAAADNGDSDKIDGGRPNISAAYSSNDSVPRPDFAGLTGRAFIAKAIITAM